MLAAAPLGLIGAPLSITQVQAQEARVSFGIFFNDLRPHGVWVKHPKYRYIFCPKVDADWRPYTHGRWIYLRDRGWYFDSREPFAWAVYHYGRWTHERRLGWCWVPGNHWAPAWVSWRRGHDHIGWAPLPPERDGFQISINVNVGEPPEDDWVFVPTPRFIEPQLNVSIEFGNRARERFRDTEYAGPVVIQNNVVINNNIDINVIQQQTNNQVTVVTAENTEDPAAANAEPSADKVQVFAPTVDEPKEDEAPEQAVEPNKAGEELGKPPEGEQPADAADQPATDQGAAPADGTQPPADGTKPADCPEGQQLVDGKCVPTDDQPAPATDQPAAPATDQPAAPAADQPAAPADQPAAPAADKPAEEAAPAADQSAEPVKCPEGQQLVDGKCVPIEQKAPAEQPAPAAEQPAPAAEEPAAPAAEPAAPAEEPAAPAEEKAAPAEEAAPADQAPADEKPLKCPEGQVLVDGKCVPAEQAPAQ